MSASYWGWLNTSIYLDRIGFRPAPGLLAAAPVPLGGGGVENAGDGTTGGGPGAGTDVARCKFPVGGGGGGPPDDTECFNDNGGARGWEGEAALGGLDIELPDLGGGGAGDDGAESGPAWQKRRVRIIC